ncbi:cryptochrome/photolyase family protein [Sinirhodobacter huangdaonensis]|uniref:Deoxyribodipyrimidine photo-lyase n=1 Tax=Paenirhodobacter huangdaonensis TaxID=2501515 RepID=A0A443LWY8_9RHOB|nr:deoxyribodipyrimidine photo-lyase [Sinirhodobacter huangdaonensis]RWR53733.1 deoxyribodipyrimidine photo-lyase [Sinirhodobacter huangdaonensis]
MGEDGAIILWLRRDFRLADHPALSAAAASGRPVIPVFVLDPGTEAWGAAPRWRLGAALAAFDAALGRIGARLVLRRGGALETLLALIAETGATAVCWSRDLDPAAKARDTAVKAALKAAGIAARSFPGQVLFDPWTVETGQGGPYRVFTPYWKAVRGRDPGAPLPAVTALRPPHSWPASEALGDWRLGAAMNRGAAVVARHAQVGEVAALARLDCFLQSGIETYAARRDLPAEPGTSGLSENLAWGEISARTLWHAGRPGMEAGAVGAETFLRELVWRDFAWHLMAHFPELGSRNWRPEWDAFPWQGDSAAAERWRRGETGAPFVDAAMRELFVTGTMHNRARMITASYLTKHLLTDWRVGLAWFAETLIDWDPASNAMGWQWVAGSGPDASPFFRIFNPEGQAAKFDPDGRYRRHYLAAGAPGAQAFFAAAPRSWNLDPAAPPPAPLVDLAAGRARALAAYQALKG